MSASDTQVDLDATLGELVLARPELAQLFGRLQIDYCCNGQRTLGEAAEQRGLDPTTIGLMLDALGDDAGATESTAHDVSQATVDELVAHIVEQHHEPLRRELARLGEVFDTVVRVHGADTPVVHEMHDVFVGLSGELTEHMESEEAEVFPACRAAASDTSDASTGIDNDTLFEQMKHEHAEVGQALVKLRELSDNYDGEQARCGTHRSLLSGLESMEADLHQHIHEENNVLFPRVRQLVAGAA